MKIKEILEEYKGKYEEVEIYKYTGRRHDIHTDFIESVWDSYGDYDYSIDDLRDVEASDYELMGEEEYNRSVMANTSCYIEFDEIFETKDARVLVIMLDESFDPEDRIFFFYYWTGEPFMSEKEYFDDGDGKNVYIRTSSSEEALRVLAGSVNPEYDEIVSKCWAEEVDKGELNEYPYKDSIEW